MEIVLLGHMGRDEAAADRLEGHRLNVLGQWENPGLAERAEASGGYYATIGSIKNVELIADYVQSVEPDMFFTNFDDALAAGVVDAIKRRVADKRMPDLLLPCPDREASRVEWDKFFLRELIDEIDPKYNPVNFMAETTEVVNEAVSFFASQDTEIVVKPRNLTGGKGVKVQGKHYDTHEEGQTYALKVLAADDQTGVEIQEKLEGHEFTLQLFTDGATMIKPPATYDYPYREDGDIGPGTGGMGTFTMPAGEQLPFITQEDYDEATVLMDKLLQLLKDRGIDYKGILYPTFFKTKDGLKIVEINARGGDPEMVNIVDSMEDGTDLGEVLRLIARAELAEDSVRYQELASAMLYLVSHDYGYKKSESFEFGMNLALAGEHDLKIRFAAAEKVRQDRYRTVGTSRTVGISGLGANPWEVRTRIHAYIQEAFEHPLALAYRQDVADETYIRNLAA